MNNEYDRQLSGRIQMDEALFTHSAGSGRRGSRQVWTIGMVEERTREAQVFIVANRTSRIINNLINLHIERHSCILQDGWAGYDRIPSNYTHIRLVRGHDNQGNSTILIEGLWGEIRQQIRATCSAGVIESNVNQFIQEALWRRTRQYSSQNLLQNLISIKANNTY